MANISVCDRCGKPLPVGQDRIADFLAQEYPGQDICPNCDLEINLASETAKADSLRKLPPGTTAKRMLENYE